LSSNWRKRKENSILVLNKECQLISILLNDTEIQFDFDVLHYLNEQFFDEPTPAFYIYWKRVFDRVWAMLTGASCPHLQKVKEMRPDHLEFPKWNHPSHNKLSAEVFKISKLVCLETNFFSGQYTFAVNLLSGINNLNFYSQTQSKKSSTN